MTLAQLWLALAVALPVLGGVIANLQSVDLAYHLRAGAGILDTGTLPVADTWTFTIPGSPWADQQWLAQVILAGVYRLGGWTGLVLLRALLVGLTFGFLARAIRTRAPDTAPRTVALLVLAAFAVSATTLALRPQLFGITLFAATAWLLADRRNHPRRAWLILPLAAAWANLHGSFLLAPVLVGLAWLEDRHAGRPEADRLLLLAVTAGLAASLNPLGAGVWAYAAGLSTNPAVTSRITEWQPTTLHDGQGLLFWGSVGLVTVVLARRGAVTPWPALLALGAFAALGAWAVRGLAWWPIVASVTVAGLLPSAAPAAQPAAPTAQPAASIARAPRRPAVSRLNAALLVVVALVTVALLPAWRPIDPALGAPAGVVGNAPPGITAALREIVTREDRIWNPQAWGSWFEFALPEAVVAIDARTELFPERVWAAYETVSAGADAWAQILDVYGVTIIVATDPEDAGLLRALAADPHWARIHQDEDGTIWVRTDRAAARGSSEEAS